MIVLALPLAVEVEVPSDSSVTQLRVAGGGGHYVAVIRDCDGNAVSKKEDSFYDVAAGVDHKFSGSPISLGVSGGFLHDGRFRRDPAFSGVIKQDSDQGYYYVTPSFGLMWRRFGISAGATYFSKHLLNPDDIGMDPTTESEWLPSIAMRIGSPSGPYFTASVLSAFPMYSGGGYADLGLGGNVSDRMSLWGGVNLVGLTATGVDARLQWKASDRFYLDGGASFGQREGESQYGGTIGVTYRVVH
jgi:hypothetical protein